MPPKKNTKKEILAVEPRPVRNTRNQEVNYFEVSPTVLEKQANQNGKKAEKNGEVKPKTAKAKSTATKAKGTKKKNEVAENGNVQEEEEEVVEEKPAKKTSKKDLSKNFEKQEETKGLKRKAAEEKKPKKAAASKKTKKNEPADEEDANENSAEEDIAKEETANEENIEEVVPSDPKPKIKPGPASKTKLATAEEDTEKQDTAQEEKNIEEDVAPSDPKPKGKPGRKPGKSGRGKKEVVEPDSTVDDPKPSEAKDKKGAKKPKNKKNEPVTTTDDKTVEDINEDEAPEKQEKEAPAKKGRQPKRKEVTKVTGETEAKKPKTEDIQKYSAEDLECHKLSQKDEKWNLKICSWNVDGYRAWINKKAHEFMQAEKPDIFCIQEVRCPTDKLPSDIVLSDYHNYWLCGEKDGYAGVGLLSKTMPQNVEYGLGNPELDEDGRIITAEYSTFYVVCTYVPNAGRGLVTLPKRLKWNEALLQHLKNLDKKKPVILCGDMNVAHTEIDLANPKSNKKNAGFTPEERQGMSDLLANGFVDTFRSLYPDKTGAYTFWSFMKNSRAKNVGWRLDYFILSERIAENVCDQVLRTDVMGSDHCPVTLFMHMRGLPEREIQRGSDTLKF